jgi:hypothetical protein
MDGLTFAAVLLVGVIVFALAVMVHGLNRAQTEHTDALTRLERMLAELPAKLTPVEEHASPLEAAERFSRLSGAKQGRAQLQARLKARGWTWKAPKGFKQA